MGDENLEGILGMAMDKIHAVVADNCRLHWEALLDVPNSLESLQAVGPNAAVALLSAGLLEGYRAEHLAGILAYAIIQEKLRRADSPTVALSTDEVNEAREIIQRSLGLSDE